MPTRTTLPVIAIVTLLTYISCGESSVATGQPQPRNEADAVPQRPVAQLSTSGNTRADRALKHGVRLGMPHVSVNGVHRVGTHVNLETGAINGPRSVAEPPWVEKECKADLEQCKDDLQQSRDDMDACTDAAAHGDLSFEGEDLPDIPSGVGSGARARPAGRGYTFYVVQESTENNLDNCNLVKGSYWNAPQDDIMRIRLQFKYGAVPATLFIQICPKNKALDSDQRDDFYYPLRPLTNTGQVAADDMYAENSWYGFTYASFDRSCRKDDDDESAFDYDSDDKSSGTEIMFYGSNLYNVLYLRYVKNFGYEGDYESDNGAYATLDAADVDVTVGCCVYYCCAKQCPAAQG